MTSPAKPRSDTYEVPPVFADRGFPGFELIENPPDLVDENVRPIPPSDYTHFTLVNGRTQNANKTTSPEQIAELIRQAEGIFAESTRVFEQVAAIGGMPVLLKTNALHSINFWSQNWYLLDTEKAKRQCKEYGLPLVEMRCAIAPGADGSDSAAYFCRDTNQTVFLNTDYYGQLKSWALGAAGVDLARFDMHSIHGAVVDYEGRGILIIAPTGTGKSTYTNVLSRTEEWYGGGLVGRINSDDWVYVKDGIAYPSERYLYVRTNAVNDQIPPAERDETMKHMAQIFDDSACENVPVRNGQRLYSEVPNSRAMIDPSRITKMSYASKVDLIILLCRDDETPYLQELNSKQAVAVLEEGKYMVQPGGGPKEMWGQIGYESWYNPYLLKPDPEFERRMFARYGDEWGARYLLINTGAKVNAEHFGIKKSPGEYTYEDYQTFIYGTARLIVEKFLETIGPSGRAEVGIRK